MSFLIFEVQQGQIKVKFTTFSGHSKSINFHNFSFFLIKLILTVIMSLQLSLPNERPSARSRHRLKNRPLDAPSRPTQIAISLQLLFPLPHVVVLRRVLHANVVAKIQIIQLVKIVKNIVDDVSDEIIRKIDFSQLKVELENWTFQAFDSISFQVQNLQIRHFVEVRGRDFEQARVGDDEFLEVGNEARKLGGNEVANLGGDWEAGDVEVRVAFRVLSVEEIKRLVALKNREVLEEEEEEEKNSNLSFFWT